MVQRTGYRALVRPSLLSPRQRKGRKDYKERERRIHLFAKEVSLMVERGNKALPAMVQRKEISQRNKCYSCKFV
jgi:hypothetical protein